MIVRGRGDKTAKRKIEKLKNEQKNKGAYNAGSSPRGRTPQLRSRIIYIYVYVYPLLPIVIIIAALWMPSRSK